MTILNVIVFTIIIFFVATSPIPSLPVIFLSYKQNGLLGGYISVLLGGHFASLMHFYLSRRFSQEFLNKRYPRIYTKVIKYKKIINKITLFEFILLLISGVIPSSILSISAGLSKIKFKTFFLIKIITLVPQQLFYTILATQLGTVDFIFFKLGLEKYNNIYTSASFLSLLAVLALLFFKILKILIKKFKILKGIYSNKMFD